MNILHISNKPVFPAVDGGCMAMGKLLENLSQIASVEHAFIQTPKHPFSLQHYPSNIRLAIKSEDCTINTSVRPIGALLALLSGKNYNLIRFHSQHVEQALIRYLKVNQVDVIVLESLFLTPYIRAIREVFPGKIIVRTHNVEHELWEQQARDESNFMKRTYLRSLARSLKKEELQLLNSADELWTITQEDAERFAEWGVQTTISVIPVAIETTNKVADYSCNDFFHLGSMNWMPNKLAVKRLTDQLWPRLTDHLSSTLHIAGSFSESTIQEEYPQIIHHGFVDDLIQFMTTHGILVSPVTTGSGVRIKLLEAMALGVPCITTPLGATGIRVENQLMIAQTDPEWIDAMKKLASSEEIRKELGSRAQSYMKKYHSFAVVNAQIRSALES